MNTKEHCQTPMAPELGLFLCECIYHAYNTRFGETHEPLSLEKYADKVEAFKTTHIYPHMAETEKEERVMENWIRTLPVSQVRARGGGEEAGRGKREEVAADQGEGQQEGWRRGGGGRGEREGGRRTKTGGGGLGGLGGPGGGGADAGYREHYDGADACGARGGCRARTVAPPSEPTVDVPPPPPPMTAQKRISEAPGGMRGRRSEGARAAAARESRGVDATRGPPTGPESGGRAADAAAAAPRTRSERTRQERPRFRPAELSE